MKPVQVSQVNKYIKTVLQHDPLLSTLSVIGEVSNLKYHGSGHVYFSLKDRNSRISCFLPENRASDLRYPLEEGMEIVASGYIYLYEKGGSYSLNVQDIRIEGEGNLAAAFERLKQKLRDEGLFDEEYKKPLPFFPKTVALVTSDTGAVVWDMIRTIRNKNHCVDLVLCPCRVQGDGAAAEIAAAIEAVNRMEKLPDVMIVGRGGGSAEELWAFNEERVARSIFLSEVPVISAVGHETDVTIADFAADFRAATPTGAAEAAVPDVRELLWEIRERLKTAEQSLERKLRYAEAQTALYARETLAMLVQKRISGCESGMESRMKEGILALREKLHREELRMERLKAAVDSMNPERVLEQGYGIVAGEDGAYRKSVEEVRLEDRIRIYLKDGRLTCRVEEIRKGASGRNGEKKDI